jgi:hypothetical protein
MIEFETKKPEATGPRAAVYQFAKKHKLGDDEAERIFLKVGAFATEEELLAEAKLGAPNGKTSAGKAGKV